MELIINHLYSTSLNMYGDIGNIIALKYMVNKIFPDVKLKVNNFDIGDTITPADIYFIGGGQDKDQLKVFQDLIKQKEFIVSEVNKNKTFILICGGYQLFGKFFLDAENNLIPGLGILDIQTEAAGAEVKTRCIGNLIVEMSQEFIDYWDIKTSFSKYLVGFENHGGQTNILSNLVKPIGKVISGFGNNYTDKVEGSSYKNVIGSYMHGSLLPKNPHLNFAILRKALLLKYAKEKKRIKFILKDFEIEHKAHEEIIKLYG